MKRIFVVRHLTRNKKHGTDPQTPTLMGEVEALVMGVFLRREYGANFVRCVSSPQSRGTRTADLLLGGWAGWGAQPQIPDVETAKGLDDFSSDPRFKPLKADLKATKVPGAIESEQAIFLAGGDLEKLRLTKLAEAVAVIDAINEDGDVLVGGLHGATIDGLYACYEGRIFESTPPNMSAFGRQIKKCEGFVLLYNEHGGLETIGKIERPHWLNALACLIM